MLYTNSEIVHLFFRITNLMKRKRHQDEETGKGGLPNHHPPRERDRLLGILVDHPEGVSQRYLAEVLCIRPQSAAELLGKLENDALIERTSNPDDKRASLVKVTQEGSARYEKTRAQMQKADGELLSCLTEAEKAQLSSLLEKVLNHAETAWFAEQETMR